LGTVPTFIINNKQNTDCFFACFSCGDQINQGLYILRFWEIHRPRVLVKLFLRRLLPKKCKQQSQDDADKDGGNNGKVESEVLFSDDDISGKSSDPGNLVPDHQKESNENDENTQ